jgi:hypothetical protein
MYLGVNFGFKEEGKRIFILATVKERNIYDHEMDLIGLKLQSDLAFDTTEI